MKTNLKGQGGFTLIELIAVIVILGILAAVAIPRFMDLRTDAEVAVAKGGVAAGLSALNLTFARQILDGTTSCESVAGAVENNIQTTDVTVTFSECANDTITVTGIKGDATETADWDYPGVN